MKNDQLNDVENIQKKREKFARGRILPKKINIFFYPI